MGRKKKQLPSILSEEEFRKIGNFILNRKPKRHDNFGDKYFRYCNARDFMIFYLIFYLGLRPKESYALEIEHLDLKNKIITIPAYNNKERDTDNLTIPEFVYSKLCNYLWLREEQGFENNKYVFPVKHHKNKETYLSRSSVVLIFANACKAIGIYKKTYIDKNGCPRGNYNPYSLRHSFGTRVYLTTGDIKLTAIALRHHDPQSRATYIYVHLAENLLRPFILEKIYPFGINGQELILQNINKLELFSKAYNEFINKNKGSDDEQQF